MAAGLAALVSAHAQDAPTIDTEDASLGSAKVGEGVFHPMASLDIRNGDFARGGYDDDAANLDRLPVHAGVSAAFDLHAGAGGEADAWLVLNASNGFHSPIASEAMDPRGWYESNNLAGLVVAPFDGFKAGLAYAIKTSPNLGSVATTHEASATFSYEGDGGLGALHPGFVATIKPRRGQGQFTQVSIEPEIEIGAGDDAPTLSLPAKFGVGWNGFYEPGSGDVAFGGAGLAFTRPFELGVVKAKFRAEALALVRDRTLRRMGADDAGNAAVVPLATVGVSFAY